MLEAAVLTCFVPSGVLVIINILIAFRICCLLQEPTHAAALHRTPCDDPDTEEVHDNEVDVLASGHNQVDYRSVQSSSPAPSAERPVSELDPVCRPWVQLLAIIFLMLLFCLTWMSAAFVVMPPFEFRHDTVVYQCCYAVLAVSLGLFFVLYYCLCRSDVQSASCWCKQSSSSESSRWQYVKATNGGGMSHETGKVLENGSAVCDMDEAIAAESVSVVAKSVRSDTGRAASPKMDGPQFAPPVVSVPESASFYNARQNGVARKYWERSRKKRAMACLYHNETQLRFGDDSKPDGTSGNTTPNGNVKATVNGVQQKVVTAAIECVPEGGIELPDEQQPLLSLINSHASDRRNALGRTGSDVDTNQSSVNGELFPLSDATDSRDGGNFQTSPNDGKTSVTTASALCVGEQSSPDEQAASKLELHSVGDTNSLHPASSKLDTENDSVPEECRSHSPNAGTAHAFINKNYCASIPRASGSVHKLDDKDVTVNEASADVSAVLDAGMADVWVRQHSKPLKLKTETSV